MALNLRDPNSYTQAELLGNGAYQDEEDGLWYRPTEDGNRERIHDLENFDLNGAREDALKKDALSQGYVEVGENTGGRAGLQDAISRSQAAKQRGFTGVDDYYARQFGPGSFEKVGDKEYYKGETTTARDPFDFGLSAADPWGDALLAGIAMVATAGVGGGVAAGLASSGVATGTAAGVIGGTVAGAGVGGMTSEMRGGSFGEGALKGALGGAAAGGVGAIAPEGINPVLLGAAKGAAAGAATGGNPLLGAAAGGATGLIGNLMPAPTTAGGGAVSSDSIKAALDDAGLSYTASGDAGVDSSVDVSAIPVPEYGGMSEIPAGALDRLAGNTQPNLFPSGGVDQGGFLMTPAPDGAINNLAGGSPPVLFPARTDNSSAPQRAPYAQQQPEQQTPSLTPEQSARMDEIGGGDDLLGAPGNGSLLPEPAKSGFFDQLGDWVDKHPRVAAAAAIAGIPTVGGFIKNAMSPSVEDQAKAIANARADAEKKVADSIRANNNLAFLSTGRLKPSGKTLTRPGLIKNAMR